MREQGGTGTRAVNLGEHSAQGAQGLHCRAQGGRGSSRRQEAGSTRGEGKEQGARRPSVYEGPLWLSQRSAPSAGVRQTNLGGQSHRGAQGPAQRIQGEGARGGDGPASENRTSVDTQRRKPAAGIEPRWTLPLTRP